MQKIQTFSKNNLVKKQKTGKLIEGWSSCTLDQPCDENPLRHKPEISSTCPASLPHPKRNSENKWYCSNA